MRIKDLPKQTLTEATWYRRSYREVQSRWVGETASKVDGVVDVRGNRSWRCSSCGMPFARAPSLIGRKLYKLNDLNRSASHVKSVQAINRLSLESLRCPCPRLCEATRTCMHPYLDPGLARSDGTEPRKRKKRRLIPIHHSTATFRRLSV